MNFIQPNDPTPLTGLRSTLTQWTTHNLRMEPGFARQGTPGTVDGLSSRGWLNGSPGMADIPTGGFGGGSSPSAGQGGFIGLINNLINQLSSYINGLSGETNAEGAGTQSVANGSFSSTGDPHLAETGNVLDVNGASSAVNRRFDSMTGHSNLLSSQDFDGGYRLSTAVTAPNANGVTLNQSATVHLNGNQDNITMNSDGSSSITSDGSTVAIDAGQIATLDGGENVTRNPDGSLTIATQNGFNGSISTTLLAQGGGVDATATVQNATVGGDIAGGIANSALRWPQSSHVIA